MSWLFLAGGALIALMGVSCALTLTGRVGKGELRVSQPGFLGWIVGCHGGLGVLGLYLMTLGR